MALDLGGWETWHPVLMLTAPPLQAAVVNLLEAQRGGIGLAVALKLGCRLESPGTFKSHYAQTPFRPIKSENLEVKASHRSFSSSPMGMAGLR